jgi:hypothetical protein
MNQQDDNTSKPATQTITATITPSHLPESEPFRYHFDQSQESSPLAEIEKPEPSPQLNDQATNPYATPRTKTPNNSTQISDIPNTTSLNLNNPPKLPLTEAEIETHLHDKDSSAAIYWLAIWCLRQYEIYEKPIR